MGGAYEDFTMLCAPIAEPLKVSYLMVNLINSFV